MYRSLLVPLDGSPFAEQALPLALSIAKRAKAVLHLVAVVQPPPASYFLAQTPPANLTTSWRAYLDQVVERVKNLSGMSATASLLEGEAVAPRIRAHAEKIAADLVVMSTHGRGALGQMWLGSVASELLECLGMPLLLLRPNAGPVRWESEPTISHVLVPLDGSALAERVLAPAADIGSLMGADYTLLSAIPDIPIGNPAIDPISIAAPVAAVAAEIEAVQVQVRQEAQRYLDDVAGRLRAKHLHVRTRVVEGADTGLDILNAVATSAIDLIALESHGRRGASTQILGSVARKVIHGSPVPILVQAATTAPNHPAAT